MSNQNQKQDVSPKGGMTKEAGQGSGKTNSNVAAAQQAVAQAQSQKPADKK